MSEANASQQELIKEFQIGDKSLSVASYSERAIVVRGDTRDFKTELRDMQGKWNSRLKGGPGWIFPKKKQDQVLEAISSLEPRVSSETESKTDYSPPAITTNTEDRIQALEKKVDLLLSQLSGIMNCMQKNESKPVVGTQDSGDKKPRKRLLRRSDSV